MTAPLQRPWQVRVRATGQTATILATSAWSAWALTEVDLGRPGYCDVDVTELPIVPVPPPPVELPSPPWADVRRLLARAAIAARENRDVDPREIALMVIAEGLP